MDGERRICTRQDRCDCTYKKKEKKKEQPTLPKEKGVRSLRWTNTNRQLFILMDKNQECLSEGKCVFVFVVVFWGGEVISSDMKI